MKKKLSLLFLFSILLHTVIAQISPPGLDGARLAAWGAVGISQNLTPDWSLTAYLGTARMSDPDNWAALKKQSIAVYNHEFQYKFNPRWQAGLGGSIRIQNKYEETPPYESKNESYRWELRYYGRLYHKHQWGQFAMNYSFRPEFRTFYSSDWTAASTPIELRFRLKAQASLPLNASKTNFIVGGNELLSAVDEFTSPTDGTHSWSDYHFTEDRLSVYFRHFFAKQDLLVDLGVMEQFKKGSHFSAVSYVSLDLILQNPFSRN